MSAPAGVTATTLQSGGPGSYTINYSWTTGTTPSAASFSVTLYSIIWGVTSIVKGPTNYTSSQLSDTYTNTVTGASYYCIVTAYAGAGQTGASAQFQSQQTSVYNPYGGPQGVQGYQGVQGLQGPTGPVGQQGLQGLQGLMQVTNNSNNGILTASTDPGVINANSNLSFNGSLLNVTGSIQSSTDIFASPTTRVGQIGYAGYAGLQNAYLATYAGNYAILQDNIGTTNINSSSGRALNLCINGSSLGNLTSTGLRLGDGTAATYKLDVIGTARAQKLLGTVSNSGAFAPISPLAVQNGFEGEVTWRPQIELQHYTGGYTHYIGTRHNGAGTGLYGNAIDFWLFNSAGGQGASSAPGTGNVNAMSVTAAGVGIYCNAPTTALDVGGTVKSSSGFYALASDVNTIPFTLSNAAGCEFKVLQSGGTGSWFYQATAGDTCLRSSYKLLIGVGAGGSAGVPTMVISNYNVGIGCNINPSYVLDVTGSLAYTGYVSGSVMDSSNNLYFCDNSVHRVRKITVSGVVTTVVGNGTAADTPGIGTAASINAPAGIAIDPTETYLYVATTGNRIVRITISTQQLSYFAGSGIAANLTGGWGTGNDGTGTAAKFCLPRDIVIDASGSNLFVTDAYNASSNGAIRRITVPGAVVTTLSNAGSWTQGGLGLAGIAIDSAASNLFVACDHSMVIQKITNIYSGTSCAVSTFVGTDKSYGVSSTQFNFPAGVCINNAKTVMYVTDASGVRSVAYPTPGNITLVAGSAAGTTGSADGIGTAATFNYPQFIKPEQYGNTLYIGDYLNYRIRKLDLATSNVTTYAGGVYNGFQDGITSSGVGMNVNACGRIYGGNPLANTPTLLLTGYGNATGYGGVLALGNSSMPLSNDFVQFAAKLFGSQGGVAQGWLSISTRSGTNTGAGNAYVERVTISNAAGSTATLVGIGCNTPAYTLDVNGSIQSYTDLYAGTTIQIGQIGYAGYAGLQHVNLATYAGNYAILQDNSGTTNINSSSGKALNLCINGAVLANLKSTGLRIGDSTAAGYTLDVNGSCRVWNGTNGVLATSGATSWATTSDSNLKNVIAPITNATKSLELVTPVYYSWKSDISNTRQIGVIAQEIQQAVPEAVGQFPVDSNDYLSVRYTELIPHLITAVKELSARLSNVEAQLART